VYDADKNHHPYSDDNADMEPNGFRDSQ